MWKNWNSFFFILLAEQVPLMGLSLPTGSLLLLVNSYASSPEKDFIPHTALGIVLLIIAALLAYAGGFC